ncbi:ATP-binding cassette domain-containing protein [Nakamurella sp. YIM 132087]|uniref:ATP-binding cassette domain-containing protein n=1 Tax=Nakamurella alba TaxID=2665158 RepID=A0A7K1FTZ1_9ACTN|nr:amino acid ABC transporter ATP-binding protein [Nakamurella alba]MTD16294.1 ATP-binding cassette domain-containing protein [Nakamurella alba]
MTSTVPRAVPGGAPVTTPAVRISGLRKRFGSILVLDGIDLVVPHGSVTVLIGPSGSGKSTLLRCVNQLETIEGGRIEVDGELMGYEPAGPGRLRALGERRKRQQRTATAMVFQSFNLFPHMTALENVCYAPVKVRRQEPAAVRREAVALLEQVGLSDRAEHYPRQLSGGQQQRVAIARALAMQPSLMLLDEPTSALDPELVGEVLTVIRDLAASGMTMLVVTHEIGFAREVADQVVFMDAGRVVEAGPPTEVLERPRTPRAREFLERLL